MPDSNGPTGIPPKLLYWVIVGLSGLLVAGASYIFDTMADTTHDLRDLRNVHAADVYTITTDHARFAQGVLADVAALKTDMAVVKELAMLTRAEQVDRTKTFSQVNEKFIVIEQKQLYFSQSYEARFTEIANRFDTISKRILSISERLDRAPMPVPVMPPAPQGPGYVP